MSIQRAPISFVLAAAYFVVAMLAWIVPLLTSPNEPLALVLGVFLTLPWSVAIGTTLDAINQSLVGSLASTSIIMIVSGLINAVLLFAAGGWLERKIRRAV